MNDGDNCLTIYERIFKDHLEDNNGNLIKEKVIAELEDFVMVMDIASRVYEQITGGRISKPNTDPSVILSYYEDRITEAINEAFQEYECPTCERST